MLAYSLALKAAWERNGDATIRYVECAEEAVKQFRALSNDDDPQVAE